MIFEELNEKNCAQVAEIDRECFGKEGWSEHLYHDEIADKSKFYTVATENNIVLGFGGYAQIFDEGHIMNIAVSERFRNRGVGREILRRMIACGESHGVVAFTLEVRRSNEKAIRLYEREGFVCAGIRKGYYPDREDACIYWRNKE